MFLERLADAKARIDQCLTNELKTYADQPVLDAMRYGLQGGKGLRGFLVLESARLHGISKEAAIWPAAAVEAMHAYSLIHDDLPCMDDDDLRRGQPTVHMKWDEATAVLAGDALQSLAFDLLTRKEIGPAERCMVLVRGLAKASGARGMVLGQAQDITAETAERPLTLTEIKELQSNKTGALIRWAATVGPKITNADPSELQRYADAVGLAFQISDDILDVEGDMAKTGKRVQKDADAGKATFVSLLGIVEAKTWSGELIDQAIRSLSGYGPQALGLREAAEFVISRDN